MVLGVGKSWEYLLFLNFSKFTILIKPYSNQPESRKEQVRSMFNKIASRYDFLNHFLSFNIDRVWRRKLVSILKEQSVSLPVPLQESRILDVATGTGDLAFTLQKLDPASITGADMAEEMLVIARKKAIKKKLKIDFILADSEEMPFKSHSFEIITVAFGVRNFENLKAGLSEMHRVLCKGGRLYILEFSTPPAGPTRFFYQFYSHKLLPFLASFFTPDKAAYHYLPHSISAFPSGRGMLRIMEECGFKEMGLKSLSGGIATIYYGKVDD